MVIYTVKFPIHTPESQANNWQQCGEKNKIPLGLESTD